VRRRQHAAQLHALRDQDLGHLRAAHGVGFRRLRQRRHGRGAVGKGAQLRPPRQAQRAQHLHEVDARRRLGRVGEVHRAGALQQRTQLLLVADLHRGASHLHCQPGLHLPHGTHRRAIGASFGDQFVDQLLAQDQQVAGIARDQLFLHEADGAEARLDAAAVARLEGRLQPRHQALRGAAAQEMQGPGHQSALMWADLITLAHFWMSPLT
jgi:hypothetical protein